MTADAILYAVADGVCLIRMEGRITYALAPGFSALIDGLFEDGTVGDVVVDLARADYLDSTALGLLGKLANSAQRRRQRKVALVAPCDDIRRVLTSIGFDDVFLLLQDGVCGAREMRDIPLPERSERERAQVMLDAHRTLLAMNDANAARFRNVVEVLEQELAE